MGVIIATFNQRSQNGGIINTATYGPCLKVTLDGMRQICQILMVNGEIKDIDVSPSLNISGQITAVTPLGPDYSFQMT